MNPNQSTFEAFNRDVAANTGYLYTTNARLSSRLANRRLSDATIAALNFRNRRVIDIGCGDGTYTVELFDRARPASIHGVDPADEAIEVARGKAGARNITFGAESAYVLPFEDDSFEIAHLRGVLHHLDRPFDALREALRVAPRLVIIEPNGYNPVLKALEKCSPYHRAHGEKSYAPLALDSWVRALGARVRRRAWVGLVPFFCPDAMARGLKAIEPMIEQAPVLPALSCAVYVMVAERDGMKQDEG